MQQIMEDLLTLTTIVIFFVLMVRDLRRTSRSENECSWTVSNSDLLKLRKSRSPRAWYCLMQNTNRWIGYFVDARDNADYQWLLMYLHFRSNGTIIGYGSDSFGRFSLSGVFGNTPQLQVVFVQHYPQKTNANEHDHYRYYRGIAALDRNGAYSIEGQWQMDDLTRFMNTYFGTFHIIQR